MRISRRHLQTLGQPEHACLDFSLRTQPEPFVDSQFSEFELVRFCDCGPVEHEAYRNNDRSYNGRQSQTADCRQRRFAPAPTPYALRLTDSPRVAEGFAVAVTPQLFGHLQGAGVALARLL